MEDNEKNIIKTDYADMMSRSYIDYAMSVITDRAVPDVRDGLKPVQRRILYDMGCELKLSPDGPYRKSARIVGDTMGKFHPHGDSSIYDAMVVMSQDFKKEVPLIDGHGNFGSVEGDGAAASRYCLAGDMRINTDRGLIKMKDIVPDSEQNSDNKTDIKVVSLSGKTESADKLFNSGLHRTKKVLLDNGMLIHGSLNHPVVVVKDGEYLWKTLAHISKGDKVAVPLRTKNLSDKKLLNSNEIFEQAINTAGEITGVCESIMMSDKDAQRQFIENCFSISARVKTINGVPSLCMRLSYEAARDMQLLLQTLGVMSQTDGRFLFINSRLALRAFADNIAPLGKFKALLSTPFEPYEQNDMYAFVPVSEITDSEREVVYSVRVRSRDHSFTACGVINHNTEARLTPISEDAFIREISEDTVPFQSNYDETTKEPEVLPALIPNFIINGSEGIAVGMTTSTPPHNLTEAIECEKYLMKHPQAKTETLMKYLEGPDFPTGGIVVNKKDLKSIYETGQGKIKIRGKIIHETRDEKNKPVSRLVITEIPYTMIGAGISKFLCDISDLADKKEIPDITDISNQSSKDGIRIVIDLKKSADYKKVEALLYAKTKLEDTFAVNILAIVDKKPMTISLKEALIHHINFIREVEKKKYASLLKKSREKLEIENGLLAAIDKIDAVIETIRGSRTRAAAKKCMMTGNTSGITFKTKSGEKTAKGFAFTSVQADAILDMRLARLSGLETSALQKEKEKTEKEIQKYEKLISDPAALDKDIASALTSISLKYGRKRKTKIEDAEEIKIEKEEEKPYPVVLLIDRFGYVRAVSEDTFEKNKEAAEKENKYIIHALNMGRLIILGESGRSYCAQIKKIPFGKLRDKSVPIDTICAFKTDADAIIYVGKEAEKDDGDSEFLVLTSGGKVKRIKKSEISGKSRQTKYISLADGERVVWAEEISTKEKEGDVVIFSDERAIRFPYANIPVQGRAGGGAAGIAITAGHEAKALYVLNGEEEEKEKEGIVLSNIPVQRRGGKGKKIEELEEEEKKEGEKEEG